MNWNSLIYSAHNKLLFVAKYWYISLALVGVLVFLLIMWQVDSCRTRKREEKIDRIEANITEAETISNVLTNQKSNVQAAVNQAANNSNATRENLNVAKNQNLNMHSNNFSEARRRYCAEFPRDCQ